MRRKGSECTRITPETTGGVKPMISLQASRSSQMDPSDRDRRPRQARRVCGSRLLRSARWTATRFYRRARASVARAFRPASSTTKAGPASAASRSPECTPARNSSRRHSLAPAIADDSHKSEAVEECIRFMNSSSRKYR
uniref:Josephin-like protein n=1 Tax=Leersia perrieri TaxID=77586 RepID=A0A0D9V7X4_9ORYZ